jgi:hypothetical protein
MNSGFVEFDENFSFKVGRHFTRHNTATLAFFVALNALEPVTIQNDGVSTLASLVTGSLLSVVPVYTLPKPCD